MVLISMVFNLFVPAMVSANPAIVTVQIDTGWTIDGKGDAITLQIEGQKIKNSDDNNTKLGAMFGEVKGPTYFEFDGYTDNQNRTFKTESELRNATFNDDATYTLKIKPKDIHPEVTFVNEKAGNQKSFKVGDNCKLTEECKSDNAVNNPTATNFTFECWSTVKDDPTGRVNLDEATFEENAELYAVYAGAYNVTFDLQGGKYNGNDKNFVIKTGENGKIASTSALDSSKLTYDGKTFGNWKPKDGSRITNLLAEVFYKDTTLFAVWDDIYFNVTFDLKGGELENFNQVQSVKYGDLVQKPDGFPHKEGYKFIGFYETGKDEAFDFENTPVMRNYNLEARYVQLHKVRFEFNDGKGGNTTIEVPHGSTVEEAQQAEILPSKREGFEFDHWEYAEGDNAGDKFNYSDPITQDVKLQACWNKLYKILDGENQTIEFGKGIDLVVKADGEKDDLVELLIDGEALDKELYEITKGSTVARVKSKHLDTLSAGDHELRFKYRDGYAATNFKMVGKEAEAEAEAKAKAEPATGVKPPRSDSDQSLSSNPKTGDEGIAMWVGFMMVSALGLVVVVKFLKRVK